jgi:DNA-binding MarR family transcriptional regulator
MSMSDQHLNALRLLHRVSLPLERLLSVADRASGCSSAQLSALSAIIFFGATTITKLAAHEKVSIPTISRIVDSLVAAGLIERQSDPADRRALRLAATAKGRNAVVVAYDGRVELLADTFKSLSDEEWVALAVAAKALNRVFQLDGAIHVPRKDMVPG